jgi:hypothetical protein
MRYLLESIIILLNASKIVFKNFMATPYLCIVIEDLSLKQRNYSMNPIGSAY